jgi:hypothetical protein
MVVLGNPHVEVYALTTSVCGNVSVGNVTNYPYFIYGGSFMADPAWYPPPHGAHLFKYIVDAPWAPGPSTAANPGDLGPWHRISGGPGLAADSALPTNTLIYKLSAGPCGKIYGGSGWDAPNSPSLNNYGDYAYFFVFDPVTERIVYWHLYPNATSVIDVLAGRDGNVYFLRQYDTQAQQTQHSILSVYNPVLHTVTDIFDSSTIPSPIASYMFTCMTWSVDHNGNPRIYIGATETISGLAYLIQLDPTPPYPYWISPTALWDTTYNVRIGTIRDLTTGIFSEEVYGVGYGQDSSGNPHGYFFMFCQCKGTDIHWGYWNPSIKPQSGDPWIAGSPWSGYTVDRLRTIVTGQEAQNGYCVSNPDPHVYMGSGLTSATLFSYLPLTPDLNLDQRVSLQDLVMIANQYGIDPPEEQIVTASPTPLNPLILASVAPAAIALAATVYILERRRISKH